MADTHPVKIPFHKIMEIRKKRWCYKYRKNDEKAPLIDNTNEMETAEDNISVAGEENQDQEENDCKIVIDEIKVEVEVEDDSVLSKISPEQALVNNKRKPQLSCSTFAALDTSEMPVNDPNNDEMISVGEAFPSRSTSKRMRIEQNLNVNESVGNEENQLNVRLCFREEASPSSMFPISYGNNYSPLSRNTAPQVSKRLDFGNDNNGGLFSYDAANTNIFNAKEIDVHGLREIIIDGTDVALSHGKGSTFSVKGLEIMINYFLQKGYQVTAFVPRYRSKAGFSSDPKQLIALEQKGLVAFTPSREVDGVRITSNADWVIIQVANLYQGIVVSNNDFADTLQEKPQYRDTIENRILVYTWVKDALIFPEDPLGKCGPHLTQFLSFP